MITIKLSWWFWNQMFQYALWKALSLKHKVAFQIDLSFLQQMWAWYIKKIYEDTKFINYELYVFGIHPSFAGGDDVPWYKKLYSRNKYINHVYMLLSSIVAKLDPHHHTEHSFSFDTNILKVTDWYVEWYFQTEKYFLDYADEIRKDFAFVLTPSQKNQEMADIINRCNAIGIHVRRWDYISNPANAFYNTCTIEYYKQAIEYMQNHITNPVFFFFSDDIPRVKENLVIDSPMYHIDFNDNQSNYEDMRLMSLCKHNIIANSSFSRWGAWLNSNSNKIVVAPERRFNGSKLDYSDIVPINWIRI